MSRVLINAAAIFGMTVDELLAYNKVRNRIRARQAAAWALKQRWPALSTPLLGQIFAGRDHSTMINALQQAEIQRERDPMFARACDALAAGPASPASDHFIDQEVLARVEERAAQEAHLRLAAQRCVRPDEIGTPEQEQEENVGYLAADSVAIGSARLLAAMQREHPERCGAA